METSPATAVDRSWTPSGRAGTPSHQDDRPHPGGDGAQAPPLLGPAPRSIIVSTALLLVMDGSGTTAVTGRPSLLMRSDEVAAQPLGYALGQRRDDDLVEAPGGHRLADGLEGVRAADEPLDRGARGAAEQRQRGLERPVRVPAALDVGDEERELARPRTTAAADLLEELRGGRRPVRDDEHPRGSRRVHGDVHDPTAGRP